MLELQLAHELLEAMQEQKQACEAMLAAKDDVAHQLADTLSQKDDEFVEALKLQASEQDLLLEHFAEQNSETQKACTHQLQVVEAALQQVASRLQLCAHAIACPRRQG